MNALARGIRISDQRGNRILHAFDVDVRPGTIVGLAGETGSGKSTLALSMLGYIPPGLVLESGSAEVDGHTLLSSTERPSISTLRDLRGRVVSYVPQDPGRALDPGLSIGTSFEQVVTAHGRTVPHELIERRADLFDAVGLPTDHEFLHRRPHELSGGQQQRVAIAIAFALAPALVVMDEPTTGLDVSTKLLVVDLVRKLARERSAGILFISHDLPLLLDLSDWVLVMRHGQLVEHGPAERIRLAPAHAYTRRLLDAVPRIVSPPDVAPGPSILTVRNLTATFGNSTALSGIDLDVVAGSCMAIIGESGSGKTTLARALAGIHGTWSGEALLAGSPLARDVRHRTRAELADLQYVFQSPWGSLNPRRTVGASIAVAARRLRGLSPRQARDEAHEMLGRVGLSATHFDSMPQRLSGGQRQRAALARALLARPRILVCDEVTSSLDVSVQKDVIDLLEQLQAEEKLTILFITHDIALATRIADSTAVLKSGRLLECGPTREILSRPSHDYTKSLIGAMERSRSSPEPTKQ